MYNQQFLCLHMYLPQQHIQIHQFLQYNVYHMLYNNYNQMDLLLLYNQLNMQQQMLPKYTNFFMLNIQQQMYHKNQYNQPNSFQCMNQLLHSNDSHNLLSLHNYRALYNIYSHLFLRHNLFSLHLWNRVHLIYNIKKLNLFLLSLCNLLDHQYKNLQHHPINKT